MTTFFKKFPKVEYTLDNQTREIVNILTAVLPKRLNIDKTYVFQRYMVSSGETPEQLADVLYNDANLWWVPMLINAKVSPYLDWRMSDEELEMYCERVYEDIHDIHHYINITTMKWVDEVDEEEYRTMASSSLPAHIIPVSNLQWETEQNILKGEIFVVNPKYVSQFVDSFVKALEGRK